MHTNSLMQSSLVSIRFSQGVEHNRRNRNASDSLGIERSCVNHSRFAKESKKSKFLFSQAGLMTQRPDMVTFMHSKKIRTKRFGKQAASENEKTEAVGVQFTKYGKIDRPS